MDLRSDTRGASTIGLVETLLDLVPYGPFNDRVVLPRMYDALVTYLAEIDGVTQDRIERAPGEWTISSEPIDLALAGLRTNPFALQGNLKPPHTADVEVEVEYAPDLERFSRINDQLS